MGRAFIGSVYPYIKEKITGLQTQYLCSQNGKRFRMWVAIHCSVAKAKTCRVEKLPSHAYVSDD